jgi:glycosidase
LKVSAETWLGALETDSMTPSWVKDAVFYHIFADRFSRSPRLFAPGPFESWESPPTTFGFKGGSLFGIAERLEYLQDLGITAIYLTPIFSSPANHRYHTYDYETVDPLLGGNQALRELLDEAHRRGMRVVLDGVFNHTGRGFFAFHHIHENGIGSPYVDWFHVDRARLAAGVALNAYPAGDIYAAGPFEEIGYRGWWSLPALPKLNTGNPAVREYIMRVAEYWIRFGIDGWRLDVPREIDDDTFWQEFRQRVKKLNPNAYIVGEIWEDGRRWLQGDQFDAVTNYLFAKAALGFLPDPPDLQTVQEAGGYRSVRTLSTPEFLKAFKKLMTLYPLEITHSQLNVLGSHDTPRFLTCASGDASAIELAVLLMATSPGVPCVYYGDEVGMTGTYDPYCRGAFPWDQSRWNLRLRDFFKQAIALRRKSAALRRGSFTLLTAKSGLIAFARQFDTEIVIIVLNRASARHVAVIELGDLVRETKGIRFEEEPFEQTAVQAPIELLRGKLSIPVEPRSGRVFELVR